MNDNIREMINNNRALLSQDKFDEFLFHAYEKLELSDYTQLIHFLVDEAEIPLYEYTQVISGVYRNNQNLSIVNCPNAVEIEDNAFRGSSIVELHANNCHRIYNEACRDCNNLQTIELNSCLSIHDKAFLNCSSLTDVKVDEVVTVLYSAFLNCTNLKHIELPKCKSIYDEALTNTNIKILDLPECEKFDNATWNCPTLTEIYLPKCTSFILRENNPDLTIYLNKNCKDIDTPNKNIQFI